jgi:hypothetical protein
LIAVPPQDERLATYAQRIKNKTGTARKAPARPAAKARPAAPPKDPSPVTPPAASGELQRLRDELQRVNQELSKIGRVTRPDAARQTHLPEKQELLRQKFDLDRKIRALSKT